MRRKKIMAPAMAGLLLALTLTGPAHAVEFEEGMTFRGDPPLPPWAVSEDHGGREDFSQQANPAIFQGELSRENYNAIRDTIVNSTAILAGERKPINMGVDVVRNGSLDNALVAIGRYPVYELIYAVDGYICNTRYPEAYRGAAEHTQVFVDGLAGLSDREKVEQMARYVADRLTYGIAYPGPNKVLTQDGVVVGCCMAYAYSFRFLCDRAGIPCILKRGGNHQWNMVYAEGQWWDVDVTACDSGDDTLSWEYSRVLTDIGERFGSVFTDQDPSATRFAQELLVPGSTK